MYSAICSENLPPKFPFLMQLICNNLFREDDIASPRAPPSENLQKIILPDTISTFLRGLHDLLSADIMGYS